MSKLRLKVVDVLPQYRLSSNRAPLWHNMICRAIATGTLAGGLVCFGLVGFSWVETGAIAQSSTSTSSEASDESTSETPETSQRPDQPLLQLGSTGSAVVEVQAMLRLLGFYSDPVDGQFGASTAIAVTEFQTAAGLLADGIVGPGTWSRLLPTPERVAETHPESMESAASAEEESTSTPDPLGSAFPVPESLTGQNIAELEPQDSDNATESSSSTGSPQASEGDRSSTSTESSPPSDESANVGLPILRQGMRGSAVVALQERLQVLGLFSGGVDGIFGPQTEAAVKAAQRQFGLSPDGVVGTETWTALLGS